MDYSKMSAKLRVTDIYEPSIAATRSLAVMFGWNRSQYFFIKNKLPLYIDVKQMLKI
jgi:hypothetical protein